MTSEQALQVLAEIVDKYASGPKQMFINAQIALEVLKKEEKKDA
jgi:hypothetical protein